MLIKVTRKHINKGKKHIRCECPIALAIKEAVGLSHGTPGVGKQEVTFTNTDTGARSYVPLTSRAQDFVARFDKGGRLSVAPITFRLPIPNG